MNSFEQLCKDVSEKLRIKTPKGDLVVEVNDSYFPGVSIDIEKEDERIAVATVESDTDNNGKITVWGFADADSDEYTHQIVVQGLD